MQILCFVSEHEEKNIPDVEEVKNIPKYDYTNSAGSYLFNFFNIFLLNVNDSIISFVLKLSEFWFLLPRNLK